jgi:peptidoglycan hydrolase CwlO-like protein
MKRRLVLLGLLFTFLSAGWTFRACRVTGEIDPADKAWAEGLVGEVREEVQRAVQTVTAKADNVEKKIDGVDETIAGLQATIEELNLRLKALRDELSKLTGGD